MSTNHRPESATAPSLARGPRLDPIGATTLICPHCGGHDTEILPGGVVAECLSPSCGWAFTAAYAEAYTPTAVNIAQTGQQELPL